MYCCFSITVFYGVRAWSCCHLANGNKTCSRLFTDVVSFKNFMTRGSQWVCRPKFTKRGTSVLKSFFSELQYSAAFGRKSRKFAGGV